MLKSDRWIEGQIEIMHFFSMVAIAIETVNILYKILIQIVINWKRF